MLRISNFHNENGLFRFQVETDSSSTALFLKFISETEKFIHAYNYRLKAEVTADQRQKDPARSRQAHQDILKRAELLEIYEQLHGPPRSRLAALREILAACGDPLGYDRTIVYLKIAREEKHAQIIDQVENLVRTGKSYRNISRELNISVGKIQRILKIKNITKSNQISITPENTLSHGARGFAVRA